MACFTVTAAAALGTSIARHVVKHHEAKKGDVNTLEVSKPKMSKKLKYLELALWNGSFILAGEHVLHGEVTPYPPFLTAASDLESSMEMLKEMGTVGVAMTFAIILAWGIGVVLFDYFKYKRPAKNKLGAK